MVTKKKKDDGEDDDNNSDDYDRNDNCDDYDNSDGNNDNEDDVGVSNRLALKLLDTSDRLWLSIIIQAYVIHDRSRGKKVFMDHGKRKVEIGDKSWKEENIEKGKRGKVELMGKKMYDIFPVQYSHSFRWLL